MHLARNCLLWAEVIPSMVEMWDLSRPSLSAMILRRSTSMVLMASWCSIDMSSSMGLSGRQRGSMNRWLVAQALRLVAMSKIINTFEIFIILF